ncbi:hypothetical protein [Nocardia sp. AG03]|uniref:hypothetical protein n=1 Tax=Nocardia sp. AG03 TaxID=3025312 RepID=UPI0024188EE9|nr:hypothetical protein [Nocardia sp. AG03]
MTSILGTRGVWTCAVEYEFARSLPADANAALSRCLGEPIDIEDPVEIRVVQRLRRVVFGGAHERSLHNLGEAETCFLLTERREFAEAGWITDNPEVLRYAQGRGIAARSTRDLMSAAVLDGVLGPEQARDTLITMRGMS